MTINTQELRRLYGAATAGFFVDKRAFSTALHNAAPALLDAADRLARIEAVMAGDEATIETLALAMLKAEIGSNEDYFAHAWGHEREAWIRDATAALAALRELIGGV